MPDIKFTGLDDQETTSGATASTGTGSSTGSTASNSGNSGATYTAPITDRLTLDQDDLFGRDSNVGPFIEQIENYLKEKKLSDRFKFAAITTTWNKKSYPGIAMTFTKPTGMVYGTAVMLPFLDRLVSLQEAEHQMQRTKSFKTTGSYLDEDFLVKAKEVIETELKQVVSKFMKPVAINYETMFLDSIKEHLWLLHSFATKVDEGMEFNIAKPFRDPAIKAAAKVELYASRDTKPEVRADWTLTTSVEPETQGGDGVTQFPIANTSGYVDYIFTGNDPAKKQIPGAKPFLLIPVVYITDVDTSVKTPNGFALGLVSSFFGVVSWTKLAMMAGQGNGTQAINDPGNINPFLHVDANNKPAKAVKIVSDKKKPAGQVEAELMSLTADGVGGHAKPLVGCQIRLQDKYSVLAQDLLKLVVNTDYSAGQNLVKSLNILTDGHFPLNFPVDRIVYKKTITVTGFNVINETRVPFDILDTAWSATVNEKTFNAHVQVAESSPNANAVRLDEVKTFNKHLDSAILTDTEVKFIFQETFVHAIKNALVKAGFRPTNDRLTTQTTYGVTTNVTDFVTAMVTDNIGYAATNTTTDVYTQPIYSIN